MEWARRGGRRGAIIELDWTMNDLAGTATSWNPPWDLFQRRCEQIRQPGFDLHVPLHQEVGVEWTRAGREIKETL